MKFKLHILGKIMILLLLQQGAFAAFPLRTINHADTTTTIAAIAPAITIDNTIDNSSTTEIHVHKSGFARFVARLYDRFNHYRQQKTKFRSLAIIFCIVCLGLHRLYTGYTFSGIVQLIAEPIFIVWLLAGGIFGAPMILSYFVYYSAGILVWQIIDFIRLLRGSFQPKHGYFTNDNRVWRRHRHGLRNRL